MQNHFYPFPLPTLSVCPWCYCATLHRHTPLIPTDKQAQQLGICIGKCPFRYRKLLYLSSISMFSPSSSSYEQSIEKPQPFFFSLFHFFLLNFTNTHLVHRIIES